jgi:hypothetical protein
MRYLAVALVAANILTMTTEDNSKNSLPEPQPATATTQTPPTPSVTPLVFAPLVDSSESEKFFKHAFELLLHTPVTILDPKDVQTHQYRLSDRVHITSGKRADGGPVLCMREQVYGVGFLNAILVLERPAKTGGNELVLLSGKKRVQVAEKANLKVPGRKINDAALFGAPMCAGWSHEKREAMLKELSQLITYSESAHTQALNDESILSLFRSMQSHRSFFKSDFHEVMRTIGLMKKHPEYRNLKRLWDLACCAEALQLLDKRKVRLNFIKRDQNRRPLEQAKKATQIVQRIDSYLTKLRSITTDPKRNSKSDVELDDYDEYEIAVIIRDVDMPGRSSTADVKSNYYPPRFGVLVDRQNKRITIPTTVMDFQNLSAPNIRELVETLHCLEDIVDQAKRHLITIRPPEAGELVRSGSREPTEIRHGERYYKFIHEQHYELYANIGQIDEYLKDKGEPLLPEEEKKGKRKQDVAHRMIDNFIKRSKELAAVEGMMALTQKSETDLAILEAAQSEALEANAEEERKRRNMLELSDEVADAYKAELEYEVNKPQEPSKSSGGKSEA